MLPQWLKMLPSEVRREVVAAAEALDHKIQVYPADLAEAIVAQRPRSLIRAIHRNEHLDEIERALASS